MNKSIIAMGCLAATGFTHPDMAWAQGATDVIKVTPDITSTSTAIQAGDYYSQVRVELGNFAMPSDDNGKKRFNQAILSALNLNNKARSLTIFAVLSNENTTLPEIPLVTYSYDSNKRVTDHRIDQSYQSPLWQLGANERISVAIVYRYSEQANYDPNAIHTSVRKLIPESALVSTMSAPFFQGLTGLTTSILQKANSRSVTVSRQDYLVPYSNVKGPRALTFSLALPNGQKLGMVKASLRASPSILRPTILAVDTNPDNLKRWPNEKVEKIALNIGGVEKNLLREIKGISAFLAMSKNPSATTVRNYCERANETLSDYGLTRLDQMTLIYRSLLDAGFSPDKYHETANEWRADCFPKEDRSALTTAIGVTFVAALPPADPIVPDKWDNDLKNAVGCWTSTQLEQWCSENAPKASEMVEKAFADQVKIGVIDLPGVDLTGMPHGRIWDKASLLTALNGKADSFRCNNPDPILMKNDIPYTLSVELTKKRISSIQILSAPDAAKNCLSK